MNWFKRRKERKERNKLVNFLNNMRRISLGDLPYGYMDNHQVEMEMLEWLIMSYDHRSGDPKEYLESLIKHKYHSHNHDNYVNYCRGNGVEPMTETERFRVWNKQIDFLYHWVYYKKIVNF